MNTPSHMPDDSELLGRYVELRSEADFAALVDRHLGSVYHAALRRSGGQRALAQDVAQEVFVALAQNASTLRRHTSLAGWLYVTTRNTTAAMLRREQRRQLREEMALMNAADTSDPDWDRLRPQLDGALDALPTADRDALLLRYFHHRPFADIGALFGLSEDAARKRVDRALERLRDQFTRRGITSTTVALGTLLSAEAAQPVPAGLSHAVVSAASASGGTVAASAVGTVHFMGAKTIIGTASLLGLAGLLSLPCIGVAVYQYNRAAAAEKRVAAADFDYEPRAALLKKLAANATTASVETARLQQQLDAARTTLAAVPAPATPERRAQQPSQQQQRADADQFLASFPEARDILLEIGRRQLHRSAAAFYKSAGLTSAQIDEFETRTAEFWVEHAAMTRNSMVPTVGSLPPEQLKAIFGEDGYQKWTEYQRMQGAYGIATMTALRAGYTATPLTEDQINGVAQLIATHNRAYQAGQNVDELSTDWPGVVADAQKQLPPDQLTALQATLVQHQYEDALRAARKTAAGDVAKGTP